MRVRGSEYPRWVFFIPLGYKAQGRAEPPCPNRGRSGCDSCFFWGKSDVRFAYVLRNYVVPFLGRPMRPTALLAIALCAGIFGAAPGVAYAGHDSSDGTNADIGALVAEVAEANQRLSDLGAAIQQRQEGVNRAIVDVQTA